jgi:predicted NUDIX family NTP pyrophosphohydrolase
MIVESAGLVILYDNKILLEHPKGQKWFSTYSIPKGHVEEGEDHLHAALRETEEELGLKFTPDQINTNGKGYINYTDNKGVIYKRVYFYILELNSPIQIDQTKLQKDEIDYAGFLSKNEAEKRIFKRFKPLLVYLK